MLTYSLSPKVLLVVNHTQTRTMGLTVKHSIESIEMTLMAYHKQGQTGALRELHLHGSLSPAAQHRVRKCPWHARQCRDESPHSACLARVW